MNIIGICTKKTQCTPLREEVKQVNVELVSLLFNPIVCHIL